VLLPLVVVVHSVRFVLSMYVRRANRMVMGAKMYRTIGEMEEKIGNAKGAMEAYNMAAEIFYVYVARRYCCAVQCSAVQRSAMQYELVRVLTINGSRSLHVF
jgi:hypothetical protein